MPHLAIPLTTHNPFSAILFMVAAVILNTVMLAAIKELSADLRLAAGGSGQEY